MWYIVLDVMSVGEGIICIVFEFGIDFNQVVVCVKIWVDQVMFNLLFLVQWEGVIIIFIQFSMLLYVNFYSDKGSNIDEKFLYNYVYIKVILEFQWIKGIVWANILGFWKYVMWVWFKFDWMCVYKILVKEVLKVMEE